MKLTLSRFDPKKKVVIIYGIPNQNISDEMQENLLKVHDKFQQRDLGEEMEKHDIGAYLSYVFQAESAWFSDVNETLMLSLYFEEHENTHFFKEIMEDAVQELREIPNLTKALYVTTPHSDSESYKIFGRMIQVLTSCFFEANKLHATYNLGIAEVLMLGSKVSGKTSIVDYLIHGRFIPQARPTLTPRVMDLVYDQLDFRVLDVCCEEHVKQVFEDHPIEPGKLPQAIVYVVDGLLDVDEQEAYVEEFHEWMQFLAQSYPPSKFKELPVLILFNKVDLSPDLDLEAFKELYSPNLDLENVKHAAVSAKTGQGLEDSFSWLVKGIKVTEKY